MISSRHECADAIGFLYESAGYLEKVTGAIMDKLVDENSTSGGEVEILGVITKPFVNLIVQIDKNVLECWSQENCTTHDNSSLIKENCAKSPKSAKRYRYELPEYLLNADEISTSTTPAPTQECKFNALTNFNYS